MAREADRRRCRGLLARRHERVEAPEQSVALRATRRVRESLGREEGRNRQRLRVAEREIRQRRQPRLEAVHDVEVTERKREREVRPHTHGDPDAAAARDRYRRPERDDLGVEAVEQCAPPGCQLLRPIGRGEDRDRVPEAAQLPGDSLHVFVHVVRLRPGKRRNQAEPHRP